ncbi:MAG: FAD-binding oxidoreductase [Candidatus Marinimicrobia bacterium]|nr:FAD-binding oxidoreductase [Candidatus Neomarinimicrobiota bacterium]|tara:strand:+ start:1987 stop:3426 length:1440 start_codon:yes stop_codon:yes gene_type:complete
MEVKTALIRDLESLLGKERVISHPTELLVYECDGLTLSRHGADAVVLPESTEEVSRIVKCCQGHQVPFLARGSGTGLSGGAVAAEGGVIVQMSRMATIIEIDYDDEVAVVQPGVINLHLSEATRPDGYHYAPDPSSQKACTIGGNVAENAGGPHTLKYGVTANHILGMTVVMPDGEIINMGGRHESILGYDLVGLFVGSEGTLGIVTEIIVKLTRNPESSKTFLASFNTVEAASNSVSSIIAAGIIPAALELIDALVIQAVESHLKAGFPQDVAAILLIEIEGLNATLSAQAGEIRNICHTHGATDFKEAKSEPERAQLWRGRKEAIGALGKVTPAFYTNDGVVPRSKLPEILEFDIETGKRNGLQVAHLCHAGDGNIHPIILYDHENETETKAAMKTSREILQRCIDLGGALSGEHGIGTEKLTSFSFMFNKTDEAQMMAVRSALSPSGKLNPSKIFPTGAKCGESKIRKTVAGGGWL